MRVVLDTNTILSGLFGKGNPKKIIYLVESGRIELCLTPNILDEVKRVLAYPHIQKWMAKSEVATEEVIAWLLRHARLFEDIDFVKVVAEDPSDDKFIDCAIVSGARVIITGDKHLKDKKVFLSIRIMSPTEFLKLI